MEDGLSQRNRTNASAAPRPAHVASSRWNTSARRSSHGRVESRGSPQAGGHVSDAPITRTSQPWWAAIGAGRRAWLQRWQAIERALAARPLLALGLLALASLVAYVLQGGMSERLRLTTQQLVNRWDRAVSATMPGAGFFRALVSWVPRRLPAPLPGSASSASPFLMAMVGYVATMALLFALYALALHWLARHPAAPEIRWRTLLLIGGAGALFSALLLFTPAAPSHDPFAYASGGRLLGIYHANPFFVVPSAYPHDPILIANEWRNSTTAYGPLWAVLSLLLNPLVGADPLRANMVYRVLAYAAHLANILLVAALVRQLPPRQQAWRERGLLLYAWNPLLVVEVAAGHNDVLMLTPVLAALLLLARGRRYPAMVCLGAAILIKANALPLALIVLLALFLWTRPSLRARERVRALAPAATVAGVALVGYLPFLWGHSPSEIAAAMRLHPNTQSLTRALTSSFDTLADEIAKARLPAPLSTALAHGALALAGPTLWTLVLALVLLATTFMLLAALRRAEQLPAALAWVYAAWMVFLSIFMLLRTWYVIPLVGLVSLSPVGRPIRRFVLVLTASMQLTSFFISKSPPFGGWQQWTWLPVVGIPLAVLIVDLRREGFDRRAVTRESTAVLVKSLAWLGMARGAESPGMRAGAGVAKGR